jgi:DNA-binding LytR/AlgR family response regulator
MKWVGQQQDRMEEANASVRLQLRKIQADADRSALQERSANRRALLFLLLVLVVGVMSIVLLQRYRKSKMQAQSFSEKLSEAEEETERLRKLIKMRQQNRGEGAAFDDTQRIRFSKNLQISPASISHLESEGNYVRIVPVESGKPELQERMTLKYCEELLPADLFTRVHRSFIVNMTQIDRVDGELIYMKNGDDIRISRTVKNELLEL